MDRELMGRCYVWTAVSAVVGSRLLYVFTNLDRFDNFVDVFKVWQGGLVAYGGFLGGFFGAAVFCRVKGIRLLAWADCAVPSLCTGPHDHAHRLLHVRLRLRQAVRRQVGDRVSRRLAGVQPAARRGAARRRRRCTRCRCTRRSSTSRSTGSSSSVLMLPGAALPQVLGRDVRGLHHGLRGAALLRRDAARRRAARQHRAACRPRSSSASRPSSPARRCSSGCTRATAATRTRCGCGTTGWRWSPRERRPRPRPAPATSRTPTPKRRRKKRCNDSRWPAAHRLRWLADDRRRSRGVARRDSDGGRRGHRGAGGGVPHVSDAPAHRLGRDEPRRRGARSTRCPRASRCASSVKAPSGATPGPRFSDVTLGGCWLVRQGDAVRALSTVCPHAGCSVDWDERGRHVRLPLPRQRLRRRRARTVRPVAARRWTRSTRRQGRARRGRLAPLRHGVTDEEPT